MPRPFASLVRATAAAMAAFALWLPAAGAEPVPAGEAKAVRTVIEAQLAAFAADDAQRAFAYAAPSIRAMFGDADYFLAVVRGGYPVVYRHATVSFLAPEYVQATLLQGVHLTDAAGTLWLAIYQLEQQPDKSWRIAGCTVQQATGKMT